MSEKDTTQATQQDTVAKEAEKASHDSGGTEQDSQQDAATTKVAAQSEENQAAGKPDDAELAELEEFRNWKKNKSSNDEKLSAALASQKEAEERAKSTEAKNIALMSGVNPKALDDVLRCALPRVKENVTLEQAIKEVITAYPQFKANGTNIGVKTQGDSGADTLAARKVMGLEAKKDK